MIEGTLDQDPVLITFVANYVNAKKKKNFC